jgi:hypothetical protein
MSKTDLRKEAYNYILQLISGPSSYREVDPAVVVPLSELNQLKEGTADPSPILVAFIKQLFNVSAGEIDSHLVIPFEASYRHRGDIENMEANP